MLVVERGEGRRVAATVVLSFCLAIAYVTSQSAAYALFVERFSAGDVALTWVAAAPATSLIAGLFVGGAGRFATGRLLLATVVTMAGVTIGLRLGLALVDGGAVRFLLPVWDVALNNLSNVVIGVLANELFDLRQAKRLGGVLGVGRAAALVVGGLSVPLVLQVVGTADMYTITSVALVVAALVLRRIVAVQPLHPPPAPPPAARPRTAGRSEPTDRRYLATVLATVLLTALSYLAIKNGLYITAAERYPTASTYAARLAIISALQGLVTLVVLLFVSGHVFSRFGLRSGLLAFPVTLLVLFVPALIVEAVASPSAALLFTLMAAGNVVGGTVVHAMRTPATGVLHQPLGSVGRARASALAAGVVEPMAAIVGGLGLALVAADRRPTFLVAVIVGLAAATIPVVALVHRQYRAALQRALARRWINGDRMDLADASTVATLEEALRAEHTDAAATLLELLEEAGVDLAERAPELLHHPVASVRVEVLARLAVADDQALARARLAVATLADAPDAAVREGAVHLLARRVGIADPAVAAALAGEDRAALRGALRGVLADPATAPPSAHDRLASLAISTAPADRCLAAEVAAAMPTRSAGRVVGALLVDDDAAVRNAALAAVAVRPDPALQRLAVAALGDGSTAAAAARAVEAFGPPVVADLAGLAKDPDLPGQARERVVRVLTRVGGPEAVAALLGMVDEPDRRLAAEALTGLAALHHRCSHAEAHERVEHEVVGARRCLVALEALRGHGPGTHLLAGMLREEVEHHRDRALWWASFAYDAGALHRARVALASRSPGLRPFALEAIDVALPRALARGVLALASFGPSTDPGAMATALGRSEPRPRQPAEVLVELARGSRPWVAAAALRSATGVLPAAEAHALAAELADSPHPVVADAASQLVDGEGARVAVGGTGDVGVGPALLERMALLREVAMFAPLGSDDLAEVADLLEDVVLSGGQRLFDEGAEGSSLYVVAAGSVRVHQGERTIDRRGRLDVVGELALLDGEPRVASVTADGDAHLLRLDQVPFYELLSARPEVARAILRSVVALLRARVRDVTLLRDELARRLPTS